MSQPYELRTWIVMLKDTGATVFASCNPGGVCTRQDQIVDAASEAAADREVVTRLERAVRAGAFDRWMLVAPAARIEHLMAAATPELRRTLAATRTDDLASVPADEMRAHLPEAARL